MAKSPSPSEWPRRIACLTSEATEIVFSLGAGDKIVGVSGFSVRPPEAREKPKVAAFTSIRMDKIRELKPDLLIGFSDLQKDIARELVAEGFQVFITNQRTLDEIGDAILAIGRLIGHEKQALTLRDSFLGELDQLAADCRQTGIKPSIYFEEWDDPMISGIGWVSELIDRFGGRDVFKHKSLMKNAPDRYVTSAEVIEANPDMIIGSWCGKKVNFEKIRSRQGWEQINAVKNNQLYEIKSADILAPGPSLIHGARQMASIFQKIQSDRHRGACHSIENVDGSGERR